MTERRTMAKPPFSLDFTPEHGVVVEVLPGIRRLTAPNPSPMTFTGTNSWLVGGGAGERVTVIDPGPDDPAHLAALVDAAGGPRRIERILVTHPHVDHSAGAARLSRLTGAPILGCGPAGSGRSALMRQLAESGAIGGGEGVDTGFAPDEVLGEGDVVRGEGWRIEVVETPGHMAEHLSFALGEALFSGDHVMGWATTLVSPPDGDLAAFLASLDKLRTRSESLYLPGHGDVVRNPREVIDWIRAHRAERSEQIRAALATGPRTAAEITRAVYVDLDPRLLPMAERNVLAHLLAMIEEGEVAPVGQLSAQGSFALGK